VYETLPGWIESLDQITEIDDLPASARRYVEFVEEQLGLEVSLIGTGRERERILAQQGLEASAPRGSRALRVR